MNHSKICFIYYVDDMELYAESLKYVQSLDIPGGFEVEIIVETSANSMAEGYNRAMLQSDAKYKVYLHQDVFIVNKNFISDVVGLFLEHPNLGLLGVVGSKTLPLNVKWWKSSRIYGKVLDNRFTGMMEYCSYGDVLAGYEKLQAVDGLILITQYNIRWREDIIRGWHLYDASQSLEFQRKGYDVGVVGQAEPWCVHDCGLQHKNIDEQQQKVFLREYENDLWPYVGKLENANKYPLVSVLIPAYNEPDLLRDALESVLDQTYPNIEIIIGDDSTNDRVKNFIKPYLDQYSHITFFENEKNKPDFGYQNMVNCLKRSKGEYINFLNHDDIFHSEKIERMMRCLLGNQNVRLVTSARQPFKDGNMLALEGSFARIYERDTLIDGYNLSRIVISNLRNLIGEPTTVLFERKYIDVNHFNYFNGIRHLYVGDLANWFTLLEHGDAIYIADPLSFIRIHDNQNTMNPKVINNSMNGWFSLIKQSYVKGIIQRHEYKQILNNWMSKYIPIPTFFLENADEKLKEQLSNSFKEAIDTILLEDNKSKGG